jgi:hypothetical protein
MPTYGWLLIILAIIAIWWLWSNYGPAYMAYQNNPTAVAAGLSVNRYATDVAGLIDAAETFNDSEGTFMSRLGAFFGRLPK